MVGCSRLVLALSILSYSPARLRYSVRVRALMLKQNNGGPFRATNGLAIFKSCSCKNAARPFIEIY